MDGKGQALDNGVVEWLWRTVKQEEVYVKGYRNVGDWFFDARSVLSVREHGKRATCLREAASSLRSSLRRSRLGRHGTAGLSAVALAKAGGFFQHSLVGHCVEE